MLPWILLIVLALIWGSSFILMKKALFDPSGAILYSPVQVAGLRLLIAGVVLLPISFKLIFKYNLSILFWMFLVAVFGNALPAILFTYAQTKLDSGYVGMLNSLTPIFTFLVAVFLFHQKFHRAQLIGLFIGLAGTLGLMSIKGTAGDFYWEYSLMVVFASFCYGISVNIIHKKLVGIPSLNIASVALLIAAIPGGMYVASSNIGEVFANEYAIDGLIFTSILAIVGTAFALVLFNRLVQLTDAVVASSVTYFIPIVAVLWGVWDNESLTFIHLLFGLIILTGVYLVNKKR